MSTEEWIEMKKRERADLHALANDMADKALSDPDTLAAYLTLQAKLGRCSLNNTLLVLSQKLALYSGCSSVCRAGIPQV